MVNVEKVLCEKFGNMVKVSDEKVELFVSVDYGPRILKAGIIGRTNFMKQDTKESMVSQLGQSKFKDDLFKNRGGHRFWISPEAFPRTYYPDNEPVEYKITETGVELIPPCQVANELQLKIRITLDDKTHKYTIEHFVTNEGYWPKKLAIWPITVVAENGVELIPQNTKNTHLLPNRVFAMWPYSKYTDSRLTIGDSYIYLKQDPSVKQSFKLGLFQEFPWAAYFLGGDMFVKEYTSLEGKEYPDFGCSYESYTNAEILEMETLSPLHNLESQETVSHTEVWSFYENVNIPASEKEADELAEKYNLK
ncbi:MAG: hypothetical protein E7394_05415 [Ruminococcaceae bacterium]|nr:hypothetical protein [Oscillospiraceae bacterium]